MTFVVALPNYWYRTPILWNGSFGLLSSAGIVGIGQVCDDLRDIETPRNRTQ